MDDHDNDEVDPFDVAIIGMSGRFPGARDIPTFWANLKEGVESIQRLGPEALQAAGVDQAVARQEHYVPFAANLDQVDAFDAGFFGYSPREAERLDPQQRIFLEVAWEALEEAGFACARDDERVGVYASTGISGYFLQNLVPSIDLKNAMMPLDYVLAHTANDKDFLATRVSYKLDLRGPSVTVQTACSSSLVAIHMARQSLLAEECDVALAGGVAIHLPQGVGYHFHDDYPHSADGHTRSYDADATGTMFGDGAAAVVLRRLSDALRDGDPIIAVLKGSAVNNDGSQKVGYTAPGLQGIVEVITEALANADVESSSIGYVEGHGTATPQGDPIEVTALSQAFRSHTDAVGFCALGSVKSNIGHLEHAAGAAGFIKAALMIREGTIVPSLNFERPNPRARFEGSPFYVPTQTKPWRSDGPRRACVSALGVGGTNAHVVLEEAPRALPQAPPPQRPRLLCLSGRTKGALRDMAATYASFLDTTEASFADVCFTTQQRRASFDERLVIVASGAEQAVTHLRAFAATGAVSDRMAHALATARDGHRLVWMFSGYGGQWAGLGRDLADHDAVFRDALHAADAAIQRVLGHSVLDIVHVDDVEAVQAALRREVVVQPYLFAVQVALAARFRAWGIEPDAVVGHSMGEAAAAHVAGALTLDEAAMVICHRSRLLSSAPPNGALILVGLSEQESTEWIRDAPGVSIASVNGPSTAVLSGPRTAMTPLFERLEAAGVFCRRIPAANRAGHSGAMDPLLPELGACLASLRPEPTKVPFYSTVFAQAVDGAELDARYWQRNLRQPVRLWATVEVLVGDGYHSFLELNGHGLLLPAIGALEPDETFGASLSLVTTLKRDSDGPAALLRSAGALHALGYPIDLDTIAPGGGRTVAMPTYPFQRERYWIDAPSVRLVDDEARDSWHHELRWRPTQPPRAPEGAPGRWLVLADRAGVGRSIAEALQQRGASVDILYAADVASEELQGSLEGAEAIRARLAAVPSLRGVVHCWALDAEVTQASPLPTLQQAHAAAVGTALPVLQVLDDTPDAAIWLITKGAQAVREDEPPPQVGQAPLWGLARAAQAERPDQRVVVVDLDPASEEHPLLVDDLLGESSEQQLAYRGGDRLAARLTRVVLEAAEPSITAEGTWLITGGLKGVGLATAQWLAELGAKHVVLVARSEPAPDALQAIRQLRQRGVQVQTQACDVSDFASVSRLVAQVQDTLPPLRGVVHSAVVIDDALLDLQDGERFRRVFGAKVDGAWNLHLATQHLTLDAFVLYSSIASLMPPVGQANYASANAFADILATYRRRLGCPGTSISWGAWGDVGGAARLGLLEGMDEKGVIPMDPARAFAAMGSVLAARRPHVLVANVVGDRVAIDYPIAAELASTRRAANAGERSVDRSNLRALLALEEAERGAALQGWLRRAVVEILALPTPPDDLPNDEAINSLGMDSLMAMDLRNRAKDELGVVIKLGKLFRGATIADLGERILPQLDPANLGEQEKPSAAAPQPAAPVPSPEPATPPPPATPHRPTAPKTQRAADGWLVVQPAQAAPAVRMICFPYAGGGANVFAGWAADLPPWLEVGSVELPGRGNRLHEPPLQRFEDIVDALVPVLASYLDGPFVFFGHCLGAIVMHYVAQRLEEEHGIAPLHLFVAGAGSPDVYMAVDSSTTSSDDILELLEEINFASAKVLIEDEEARELLLPGVLADFWLTAKYRYKPGHSYRVPITTFAGFEDVFTPAKQMEGWRDFTSSDFRLFVYPGGHYFIEPERASILRIVSQELQAHHARMAPRHAEAWFRRHATATAAPYRLFCLGYAGGGPDTFASWQGALPGVDVVIVEPPGQGQRAAEEPLHRVQDIAQELAQSMVPLLDRPYAIVGHELGALVAYEVVQLLRDAGQPLPSRLFVSSAQAPHRRRPYSLQYLPREAFVAALVSYKFPHSPGDWDAEDERRYRADFAARAEYERRGDPPLPMPVEAFLADRDTLVNPAGAEAWADLAGGGFRLHTVQGNHYHIDDEPSAVLQRIRQCLETDTPNRPPPQDTP